MHGLPLNDTPSSACPLGQNVAVTVASPKGLNVIDTTGAGDIFGGSAMSRFLKLGKKPEELTEAELRGIVTFACTAASLSTQKHGGISSVPDENEVLEWIARR
jgi:fructokinase